MLKWVYEDFVTSVIEDFICTALPDAHDWENLTYRIAGFDGRMMGVYEIETEIPTSADDCWLLFRIGQDEENGKMSILSFQALRSGRDGDETTYVCKSTDGVWEKAPEK